MVKSRVVSHLESAVSDLRAKGYAVDFEHRHVSGFPFRVRVAYGPVKLSSTSGWGVSAPTLQAQAYVHDLHHWMVVAPSGVTLLRPNGGPLAVAGPVLRGSMTGLGQPMWRIAVEGQGLSFTPGAAGRPFYLDRVDRLEAYLRPAADGRGDVDFLLRMAGARPRAHTVAWNLAPEAPVQFDLSGRITRLRAARGPKWRRAALAWAAAGGQVQIAAGAARGGATTIRVEPSAVSIAPDGRVTGAIALRLNQAPQTLDTSAGAKAVPAQSDPGGGVPFNFSFRQGRTFLGPIDLGPAPRMFGDDNGAAEAPDR